MREYRRIVHIAHLKPLLSNCTASERAAVPVVEGEIEDVCGFLDASPSSPSAFPGGLKKQRVGNDSSEPAAYEPDTVEEEDKRLSDL